MMTATELMKGCALAAMCGALFVACTAEQEIRCGEGTELVAGRCVPLDASVEPGGDDGGVGASCGDGSVIFDGSCQGLRPVGAPCESGEQCASETCLGEDRGAPDGYCTVLMCSGRPCPAGSRCYFSKAEEQYLCLVHCNEDGDCRDGYACQPLYTSDAKVCTPRCDVSGACPAGTLCEADSGKCVLHECELGSSESCTGADAGAGELVCYADRLGLSESGAVCLPACDPSAEDPGCARNEVCQPLPEDPASTGLCVPPLCETTEQCSPGAVCMDGVCQPPARCDQEAACGDDAFTCVGGPGGQCMPRCPEDGDDGCAELHSGLSCSTTLDACLPTGSFPGSVCRSDLNAPCDALAVGEESVPMLCEGNVCLPSCANGGEALCEDIRSTLTCAEDVFDAPLCVPKGSFPGGPCDADDECADLALGSASLPMACARDLCLVTCDDASNTGGGDVLCDSVDPSLTCIANAFEGPADLCLPRGSYPGGPCAAGDACDSGMTCEDNRCLYECEDGGDTLCNGISAGLACATGVYGTPVCLPLGTFPGSPCRPTETDKCDQDLSGLPDADMICSPTTSRCVVQCQEPGLFASGDALCGVISSSLTCLTSPGVDVCVTACGESDACPPGFSCLASQDACLPTGSFLGSPCASDNTCSGTTPPLSCVPGASPACAASCTEAAMPSGYCQAVAAMTGTTFDTCTDVNPAPEVLLICIDGTP